MAFFSIPPPPTLDCNTLDGTCPCSQEIPLWLGDLEFQWRAHRHNVYIPCNITFGRPEACQQPADKCPEEVLQVRSSFWHSYQSINQSNFYSANIPGEARLSGATAKSVFNSKIEENSSVTSTGHGEWRYLWGKAKSKRCVFTYFLKVATELAERTDSARLFQRDGAQEWKALAPALVLTLGDWQTIIIVWSQWTGRDRCSQHGMKINRLFFHTGFCRSTKWS